MRKITKRLRLLEYPSWHTMYYELENTAVLFCIDEFNEYFKGTKAGDTLVLSSVKPSDDDEYYTLRRVNKVEDDMYCFWSLRDTVDTDNGSLRWSISISPWMGSFDRYLNDIFDKYRPVYAWVESGD